MRGQVSLIVGLDKFLSRQIAVAEAPSRSLAIQDWLHVLQGAGSRQYSDLTPPTAGIINVIYFFALVASTQFLLLATR